MAEDAAIGPLVKRDGVGGRSRLIIVPDFHKEGERDQHGGRPGLARAGDPECLEDRPWDLCLVANRDHGFGHRVQQGLVGQAVNLADRSAGARFTSVTIPTIGTLSNKASPIPLMALVRPGPGTTQKTPTSPVTRAAASAMTLEEASCATRK